jgi:hypothetical protein
MALSLACSPAGANSGNHSAGVLSRRTMGMEHVRTGFRAQARDVNLRRRHAGSLELIGIRAPEIEVRPT